MSKTYNTELQSEKIFEQTDARVNEPIKQGLLLVFIEKSLHFCTIILLFLWNEQYVSRKYVVFKTFMYPLRILGVCTNMRVILHFSK